MSIRTNKRVVLAKIETTYGEDATPSGSNAIITTSDLTWTPYQGDTASSDRVTDHFGADAEVNTGPNASLQFSVPLAGSGTAGTPPAFGTLLRACAMAEDEEQDKVTYTPVTDDIESVTLYFFQDGIKQKMVGARGSWSITTDTGGMPSIQFTFTAQYSRPTYEAASNVTLGDLADEIPVNYQNTTGEIHGYSACMSSLSLDIGNSVNYFNRVNCQSIEITDREATGSTTFDAVDPSTKDFFKALESHEERHLDKVKLTHGQDAGNIVVIEGPKVQLSSLSTSDDNGRLQFEMDTRYLPDTGDDELSLTFK